MPLDTYITNLFEHSYEHWWCHRHHVKWRVTTLVIRSLFFLMTGCTQGYNQWVGGVREIKRGYHILCKVRVSNPNPNPNPSPSPYPKPSPSPGADARAFAVARAGTPSAYP